MIRVVQPGCDATFGEIAGAHMPPGMDGISMIPTLSGNGVQEKHAHLYWELHGQGGKQAVRMSKWKGVRLNVREKKEAPIELYNLDEDISKQKIVAGDHPEVVNEINRIMNREYVPSEVFPLFDSQ